jgi:pSer/pThr/pTyr-binding forkhead associated (FHA) protein
VVFTVATLTIIQRPTSGLVNLKEPEDLFLLRKDDILIGRHPPEPGIDLQLPEVLINRQHARITHVDGAYWIEDLQSRNGTFLNGTRIVQRTMLQDGDVIAIGSYAVRFSC